jgi:formate-dependent nitrite reductase membrane component NrfD
MEELQTTWGWLIAVYLFLGGLGAGAFVVGAIVSLVTGERFKSTVRFAAWASAIAIGVGVLMLLIHAGKPFRALWMVQSFSNFSSWMAIGAWLLFGAILFNGLFALFWTDRVLNWVGARWKFVVEKRKTFRVILAVLGIFINLGVAVYTGVLLSVLPFRPLWNTWWLPALFTASALDTGVGLVTGFATLRERAEGAKKLRIWLEAFIITLILVEGAVLYLYLSNMLKSGGEVVNAVQLLTKGVLSTPFWVVVVGMGLAIPLLVCLTQLAGFLKKQAAFVVPLIGLLSCLIGGWTLRYLVLSAGLPSSLASPAFSQALDGVRIFLSK